MQTKNLRKETCGLPGASPGFLAQHNQQGSESLSTETQVKQTLGALRLIARQGAALPMRPLASANEMALLKHCLHLGVSHLNWGSQLIQRSPALQKFLEALRYQVRCAPLLALHHDSTLHRFWGFAYLGRSQLRFAIRARGAGDPIV